MPWSPTSPAYDMAEFATAVEPLLAAGFGGMPGDEDQEEAA